MEFQIANEISTFWGTLVPPIFLGLLTILMFGWVAGKENRSRIMEYFSKSNSSSSEFTLQNGIYIPKNQTTRSIFIRNLSKRFGFESMKPLMLIFLVVLIFFGFNQILLQTFQPMITYTPGRLIYACGVDDYLIASIWMCYPNITHSDQLYTIILDLAKDNRQSFGLFQYSVEAFIRFDLICCFVMLLSAILRKRKSRWVNGKVILRILMAIIILLFSLAGALFINIQHINDEARNNCYEAYSILDKQHNVNTDVDINIQSEKLDIYLTRIEQDKHEYMESFYYGAFAIRVGLVETVTSLVKEFYRLFSTK